jgi:hypothetical protein
MLYIENQVHWRISVKRLIFTIFLKFSFTRVWKHHKLYYHLLSNQHPIKWMLNLKSTRLFLIGKTNNSLVVGPWCNIGEWILQGHEIKLELNSEFKNTLVARITCQKITSNIGVNHEVALGKVEVIIPYFTRSGVFWISTCMWFWIEVLGPLGDINSLWNFKLCFRTHTCGPNPWIFHRYSNREVVTLVVFPSISHGWHRVGSAHNI